ncbi:MAG: hypothetical protein ACRDSL_20400 [Pseudonocardiaceae bacterium]
MRSTTNLAWPITPFGTGQRPFGKARPMIATITVGWIGYIPRPVRACTVYLNTDSTRTLSLEGQHLNFGFEVLTSSESEQPAALAERLDDILVASRRQAKILVGHDLAPALARLGAFAVERRLPGVDAVRQQWTDRATKGRGLAKMFDTAHDLGLPGLSDLAAACEHAALKAATVAEPASSTTAETVRQAIIRTLAVALVAARSTGKYDWTTPLDLDQLVTDAAWDPPGRPR